MSFWTPNIPEYYFDREWVPLLPEYGFISEQLTEDEMSDFRHAVFTEYWKYGRMPENLDSMTKKTRKAFNDYTFALARYCAAEWKKKRKELGIKAAWEVEDDAKESDSEVSTF